MTTKRQGTDTPHLQAIHNNFMMFHARFFLATMAHGAKLSADIACFSMFLLRYVYVLVVFDSFTES